MLLSAPWLVPVWSFTSQGTELHIMTQQTAKSGPKDSALTTTVGVGLSLLFLAFLVWAGYNYLPEFVRWCWNTSIWFVWDVVFGHTIGAPFWWLSAHTGATPLKPGGVLLLYLLFLIACVDTDKPFLTIGRIAGSYAILFIAGLFFRGFL